MDDRVSLVIDACYVCIMTTVWCHHHVPGASIVVGPVQVFINTTSFALNEKIICSSDNGWPWRGTSLLTCYRRRLSSHIPSLLSFACVARSIDTAGVDKNWFLLAHIQKWDHHKPENVAYRSQKWISHFATPLNRCNVCSRHITDLHSHIVIKCAQYLRAYIIV